MKKSGLLAISMICMFALIAQKTLNFYKKDLTVLSVQTSDIDSVKLNSAKTAVDVHKKDLTVTNILMESIDSMNYSDGVLQSSPIVSTEIPSSISYSTAKVGVKLISVGGSSVTEAGICWSTDVNPTTSSNKVAASALSNSFILDVSGLAANTSYHVRAFATNSNGTSYGDDQIFTTLNCSIPVVETVSVVYSYSTNKANCLCNVKSNGGCGSITERGVCWSTSPNPTINSSKASSGKTVGQYYATMTNLNINSVYYLRAYATNCAGTAYGNQLTVKPLMGNVTYTLDLDSAANPAPYRLIKIAMDSACWYFNRYTPFRGNIYVYYNTGIPTAQASYHGSIGFGSNTRYMWVGTAMHEMCHYMGSGTTSVWQGKVVNGVWKGTTASALLLSLTGETLKGDSQHFWPYGINQKEEITNLGNNAAQEAGLIKTAKLVKAMVVDDCGLPTSW